MKLKTHNVPDALGLGDFLYPANANISNYEGEILGSQIAYFFQMVNEMCFSDHDPDIFIDVGANYGIISRMAMKFSKFSQIDAFECNSKIVPTLEKNLKFSKNKLAICNVIHSAVSNFDGVIDYTVPPDSASTAGSRNMYGLNTANPDENVGSIVEKAEVVSLDSFYKDIAGHISFIKIDVEGHEIDVLQGATALIEKHKPIIVYEVLELSKHQLTHKQLWKESGNSGNYYWVKQLDGINALLSGDPATQFLENIDYKHFVFPWSKCDVLAVPTKYFKNG